MESEITLDGGFSFRENPKGEKVRAGKYATFTWDFNDGSGKEAGNEEQVSGQAPGAPKCLSEEGKNQEEEENNPEWERPPHTPCAASVFHHFKYNGTYKVTLVVTDIAGNSEETSNLVTVTGGENPPSTETSNGTETTTGTGGSSGAATTTRPRSPRPRHPRGRRRPGPQRDRHGPLPDPSAGDQQGPGGPLLGRPAGRRPLRSPDREHRRASPRDLRAARRPACPRAPHRSGSSPARSWSPRAAAPAPSTSSSRAPPPPASRAPARPRSSSGWSSATPRRAPPRRR